MELEQALALIGELLAPEYLNLAQEMVFRSAWAGKSYKDTARLSGYDYNYIKGTGAQIWQMLTIATDRKVTKNNFREVLKLWKSSQVLLASKPVQIDWGEDIDVVNFYGREAEYQQLRQWIIIDRCQLVAILGMGGMGKTTIAIRLAQEFQAEQQTATTSLDSAQFECIIWRSLLNAPLLNELLPEIIRTLIERSGDRKLQTESMLKTGADRIELLLKICQQYRCLIILDNSESVLQSGAEVGKYRDGYADYGDLFSKLGQVEHQSCLLITSREKPIEISQIEEVNPQVRSSILPGLGVAGQQIFANRGCLPIPTLEWAEIDRYYGGNPLAFQLAAAVVQDIADGDVSEILPSLQLGELGFGDIHNLLQQQWDRLTPCERQLMYWLAIQREPMSVADLTAVLHPGWGGPERDLHGETGSSLLNVLQSLHYRSVIVTLPKWLDNPQQHWSLQPVVMEYVTGKFVNQIWTEIDALIENQAEPYLLNTHALSQATTQEYIRQIQLRLIVQPTINRLHTSIGNAPQIGLRLRQILAAWQIAKPLQPGYLAGNILNLLIYLQLDLTDLDCAQLVIQQAYLVGSELPGVNFSQAKLVNCAFTQAFSRILAIAYSPDGTILAASDSRGEIQLWRVEAKQCLLVLSGHTNWVRSICFSPDGRYLASSSDDLTIAIWDVQTGQCLRQLAVGIHSLGISFSPNGNYLASGSANCQIYYWNIETGECIRQFVGHKHWSLQVRFHPQGHQLVSSGADGTVRLWDVATGRSERVWRGHENWVTTVDYSSDGKNIISGSLDGTMRLWAVIDVAAGQKRRNECRLLLNQHVGSIWTVAFSPDGSIFASAGASGTIKIWRTSDGKFLRQLEGHTQQVWAAIFHPSGDYLTSGGEDRTVRCWQVSDGRCLTAISGYSNWFQAVAWSPHQQHSIVASRDGRVRIWDLDSDQCLAQLSGHAKSVSAIAYSPQGATFASGSEDLMIKIWDAQTKTIAHTLRGHTASISALAYSNDGNYLVSGSNDLNLRIWDLQQMRCLSTRLGHTDRITSVAYHPQQDLIASSSEDRTVKIWNLHHPDPVLVFTKHSNRVVAVVFDPGGTLVASGGMDSQILIWHLHTGELNHTLAGHHGWILTLAYSPDGKLLISGASDHTIKIWSVATGICIGTLLGHQSWVVSVSVSCCSRFLASVSEDETIRTWDLSTSEPISIRRARRPYEGMQISGVNGLTKAQIAGLKALGARD